MTLTLKDREVFLPQPTLSLRAAKVSLIGRFLIGRTERYRGRYIWKGNRRRG